MSAPPSVLIVMGVSGSGKTTIAGLLAGRLGWEFADGDDFHPPANIAKMQAGAPLSDADRGPWLRAIAAWIDKVRGAGQHGVVACSALRRSYREILVGARPDVRLVYLKGAAALVRDRQSARRGHFMPASLVDSQYAVLEEPGQGEQPIVVSVAASPGDIVAAILAQIPGVRMSSAQIDAEALKRQAAEAAVAEVEDGMVLGLGTGSTASLAVDALARRVRDGLRVVAIPTSERTAAQARSLGVQLATLDERPEIDLTIDGADEVHTGTLDLIKGLGGALLREKIVAAASRRMTVIVDESKLVQTLGRVSLPVEIVAFGAQATLARLRQHGVRPALRPALGHDAAGAPFRTDEGHYIADCATDGIADPASLHARLKAIVGVVETGLFIGMATRVVAGTAAGLLVLPR